MINKHIQVRKNHIIKFISLIILTFLLLLSLNLVVATSNSGNINVSVNEDNNVSKNTTDYIDAKGKQSSENNLQNVVIKSTPKRYEVNSTNNYATIKSVIDSMNDGDELFFNDGHYYAKGNNGYGFIITKRINITANPGKVIIELSASYGALFEIQANNVNITNLILINDRNNAIKANSVSGLNIKNVIIENTIASFDGVYINDSNNCIIDNVIVRNIGVNGIRLQYSKDCLIINSEIFNTGTSGNGNGILITDGSNNLVKNTTTKYIKGFGIYLDEKGSKIINCSSYYNGKDGFLIGSNTSISNSNSNYNNESGLYLSGSNISVENFTALKNKNNGIFCPYVMGSSLNSLKNIIANGNEKNGIYISSSNYIIMNSKANNNGLCGINISSINNTLQNINISHSEFELNENGIYISESISVNILKCDVLNNTYFGLYLKNTNQSVINNINISKCDYGIYLNNSSNNTIKNSIFNGNDLGIYIQGNRNTLVNLTIFKNENGITIQGNGNTLLNSTISKNNIGILLNRSLNVISSSNINNNNVGIHFTGTGYDNKINYNRIVDNILQISGSIGLTGNNANFNWWGNNSAPTSINGLNIINYYIIVLNSTINSVYPGEIIEYNYYFVLNGTKNSNDSWRLPFLSTNISYNRSPLKNITDNLFDGRYNKSFTNTVIGSGIITIITKLDNQMIILTLNSVKKISLITMDNIYGKLNNIVVLNAILLDKDGNYIINEIIDFYVDGKLVGSNITNNKGIATLYYISNQIGNFTLKAEFKGNNIYLNSKNNSMLSISFDSIDLDPNPKPEKNKTIKTKQDKKTSIFDNKIIDKVNMKSTGIPILFLLLVLLSLLGLAIYKK